MMIKRLAQVCMALAVIASALSFSVAAGPNSGGGGGGGGSTKPLTIRWTGIITAIVPSPDGVYVTLGTSYYAVGTGLVQADTKIKLNGDSGATAADLRIGDQAQMDVLWPSRIATKMEVLGVR